MRRRWLVVPLCVLAAASGGGGGEHHDAPVESFDFRYQVLPILQRQQCGSAYCHGSQNGRGGFKLSLFGSDVQADYLAITSELGGRRLDLLDPAASLLLKKPTRQLPHGGGQRLRREHASYATLLEWIAAGAPRQRGAALALDELTLQRVGDRLQVTAVFVGDDGPVARDVTGLCTFSSSDQRVVAVDADGVVHDGERGEAWLFARYVHRTARVVVLRPFAVVAHGGEPAATLDAVFRVRLDQLGLTSAPRAEASTLARRLYLDLVDRVPTPAELEQFVARDDLDLAVAELADELMQTPGFATKFGRHLAQWFEIPVDPDLPAPQAALFTREHEALVQAVARGDSLRAIVRRVLVDDRRLLDRLPDPRDRAELCGRALLGVRIGCARCHDSPTDRWLQSDHLGFSALFASARPAAGGGMRDGLLFDPVTREPVVPQLLPVPMAATPPAEHGSRDLLAWFVLDSGSGLLPRNFANRVFAALLGRGLVEPLDDHRDSNPAVHEAVLALLAKHAHDGDLRSLVRIVVTSQLYQSSSAEDATDTVAAERHNFARREARALDGVTFANAVATLLGTAPSSRPLVASPLARELALRNSDFLHAAIDSSPVLHELSRRPAHEWCDALFRLILSRAPSAEERSAFPLAATDPRAVYDLAYALLASREFASLR